MAGGATAVQVARMTNAFVTGHGISVEDCHQALVSINIQMIDLASERTNPARLEAVRKALAKMEEARTATEIGIAWYPFQRELAATAESGVLHVFARCLAGSILLRRLTAAELPEAEARELVQASRVISKNLKMSRTAGNGQAHRRCQHALAHYW